jgi:hypothetical protein
MTLVTSLASFGPVSAVSAVGCYVQAAVVVLEVFWAGSSSKPWTMPATNVLFGLNVGGLLYALPILCFVFAYHCSLYRLFSIHVIFLEMHISQTEDDS